MVNEALIAGTVPSGADPPAAVVNPAADTNGKSPSELQILQQEIAALKKALADQTVPSPTETVRMRRELAEIAAQRDSAANELRKIKRSQALADLAVGQHFNDAEYLDFILQKNNIEPDDAEKTSAFLQEFKKDHPRYFSLPVKSGAGSRPGAITESASVPAGTNRFDAVEMMLAGAPEIY